MTAGQILDRAVPDIGLLQLLPDPDARIRRYGLRPQRLERVERHRAGTRFDAHSRFCRQRVDLAVDRDVGAARANGEARQLQPAMIGQPVALRLQQIERKWRQLQIVGAQRAVRPRHLECPAGAPVGGHAAGHGAGQRHTAAAPFELRRLQIEAARAGIIVDVQQAAVYAEGRGMGRLAADASASEFDRRRARLDFALARQFDRGIAGERQIERLQQPRRRQRTLDRSRHKIADRRLQYERARLVALLGAECDRPGPVRRRHLDQSGNDTRPLLVLEIDRDFRHQPLRDVAPAFERDGRIAHADLAQVRRRVEPAARPAGGVGEHAGEVDPLERRRRGCRG